MRRNSKKKGRLNETIMQELSAIIRNEIKDPRIHPLTSVTAVETTTDLSFCKVYISVLGEEKQQQDTIAGLKNAAGFARKCLARSLNLRNTPQITFVLDRSIERGIEMSKKIENLGLPPLSESEEGFYAE